MTILSFLFHCFKMTRRVGKIQPASINEPFPDEIFVMIFKMLDFKTLATARNVNSKWRSVIDGFGLLSLKNLRKFI